MNRATLLVNARRSVAVPAADWRARLAAAALAASTAACGADDGAPAEDDTAVDTAADAGDGSGGDAGDPGDADAAIDVDASDDVAPDADASDAEDAPDAADEVAPDVTDDGSGDPRDTSGDVPADTTPPRPPNDARMVPDVRPPSLPFTVTRPARGEPLTDAELTAFTDAYLDLLDRTRYFAAVADRVHGWPYDHPDHAYGYGTWWSGVTASREGNTVRFLHSPDGADNNGLRSAQLLESACFATQLWGRDDDAALTRDLVRGFVSWSMSMERAGRPTDNLLSRASYPVSYETQHGDVTLHVDYSLNRPGIDNGASEYVRIADNPHWGDIWIKNKRSKDDIGHMFRAVAHTTACYDALSPGGRVDVDDLWRRYLAWARRVEDERSRIATFDADLNIFIPEESLAVYIDVPGIDCAGRLLLRLAGRGYTGGVTCGNGIGGADRVVAETRNGTEQLTRSHHVAAALHATLAAHDDVAAPLVVGLGERIDWFIDGMVAGTAPPGVEPRDFWAHIVHSANAGVPLTAQDVRWLHAQVAQAAAYFDGLPASTWDIFGADVPDGPLPYDPGGRGVFFNDLGLLLGTCASPLANADGAAALDCERVRARAAGR